MGVVSVFSGVFGHKKHKRNRLYVLFVPFVAYPPLPNYNPPMEGNPLMEFDELKTLLAIEPKWLVALNGMDSVPLDSSDISIEGSAIQLGPYKRFICDLKWLRPDVVRLRTHPKFRAQTDTITLYPGDRLPPPVAHPRRRH